MVVPIALPALAAALLLALAAWPLFRHSSAPRLGQLVVGLLAALVAIGAWVVAEQRRETLAPVEHRPLVESTGEFASSSSCGKCHPDNHRSWFASYHRTMTQVVTPATVLADFSNVTLSSRGRTIRLFRDGEGFWMEVREPQALVDQGWPVTYRRRIVMSTGSHLEQAYWYETGRGRELGNVPFVWLTEERRWVPYDAVFLQPANDDPVALPTGQWNATCIRCHVTQGRPRIEPGSLLPDSTVEEFGITCESCHGPGAEHVQRHMNPIARYQEHLADRPDPTIVNPARLDHERATESCGQCHGIHTVYDLAGNQEWNQHGFPYRPGEPLAKTRNVVRFLQNLHVPGLKRILQRHQGSARDWFLQQFWNDGTVRVSGREYNGMLETPCFQRGEMSCMSCHELHPEGNDALLASWRSAQMRVGVGADAACIACHEAYTDERALTDHTHHAPTSTGSSCVNCHMSHTTYGLLKAIRSHTIDSPRVNVTLATERPNACNLCHLDRTLVWTEEHLRTWYRQEPVAIPSERRDVAESVWRVLRGDAGDRALMAWHLGWRVALDASGDDFGVYYLAILLDDPYAAVRLVAERALRSRPALRAVPYDAFASSSDRRRQVDAAVRTWRSSSAPVRSDRPNLLLGKNGPRAQLIEMHLKHRDHRPVLLAE
ncbi:MAG: C cytochrome precursor [Planctomycetes bacterium]|nr:C cytochrome precursor [Planctomycetota bacterium]